jgi:hypothetical protein
MTERTDADPTFYEPGETPPPLMIVFRDGSSTTADEYAADMAAQQAPCEQPAPLSEGEIDDTSRKIYDYLPGMLANGELNIVTDGVPLWPGPQRIQFEDGSSVTIAEFEAAQAAMEQAYDDQPVPFTDDEVDDDTYFADPADDPRNKKPAKDA